MKCMICAYYPFCKKTTKASDECKEGIKSNLDKKIIKREDHK